MRRIVRMLVVVLGLFPAVTMAQQATTRPVGDAEVGRGTRVMVISIDGCRPDVALRANMPNFRGLLADGAYTMWARTTDVAITLPSHTSMITGVIPEKHGVDWNDDVSEDKFHYPNYPTLMELAKQKGYTTALVSAKSKFVVFARPGALDWQALPEAKKIFVAAEVGRRAAEIVAEHKPQVMMVHFGDADRFGHGIGWGSPEQVAALEQIDAGLGVVLKSLKDAGVYDETLIILTADHGGFGRSHGANDLRAAFIPWVVVGPGVRKGYDLTRIKEVAVRTEDTFATAAAFLGIEVAQDIDGKPQRAIYQVNELVKDAPPATKQTPATQPK